MQNDVFGARVSFRDPAALDSWNAMSLAFLAHGADTPVHLGALLERQPDCAAAHALKGLFCAFLGRREMMQTARECLATAQRLRAGATTPRDVAFIDALDAWLSGRPSVGVAALEEVLAADPGDTLTMKLCHGLRFILGDAPGMLASVDRAVAAHGIDHPGRGYALGCRAFALEEMGRYGEAEAAGRDGIALAADDAWGLHAVAHVYDMTHRPDAGIDLIEAHAGHWMGANNFRYHVWWHKALLHLDRGETDHVLALYDTKIRVERTDDYRDIANATSLLARLELEDVDVGDRWDELADLSEARAGDGCLVFADLHYMLAMIGGHRDAGQAALLGRIASDAERGQGEPARICGNPGAAAARGLAAFGEGRYGAAFDDLAAARAGMQRIGGSHAQRDVFERITVDAGLRAGRLDACEAILADRRARRAGLDDCFAEKRFAAIAEARAAVPAIAAGGGQA